MPAANIAPCPDYTHPTDPHQPTDPHSEPHMDTHQHPHGDIHIYGDVYAYYPTHRPADCFPILYHRADDHPAPLANEQSERDADCDDGAGTPEGITEHGTGGDVGHGMALDA